MRLYLDDKIREGFERDPKNGKLYSDVCVWSFMKCQFISSIYLFIIYFLIMFGLGSIIGLLGLL